MRKMNTMTERLALAVLLMVVLASVVAGVCILPWIMADSEIPAEGELTLYMDSLGRLILSWPEAEDCDGYQLEISKLDLSGKRFTTVSEEICDKPRCVLPELPADRLMRFSITTRKEYLFLGQPRVRLGDTSLTAETYLNIPGFTDLTKRSDPEHGWVLISWTGWKGDSYQLYQRDASGVAHPLWTLDRAGALLSFGDSGEFPLPQQGESYTFCLDATRRQEGLTFLGGMSEDVTVTLEDLRFDAAAAAAETETAPVSAAAEPAPAPEPTPAATPAPVPTAAPAPTPEPESAATPVPTPEPTVPVSSSGGAVTVSRSAPDPVYAVIWPMRDLPAYGSSGGYDAVGTTLASASYCVLGLENNRFLVRLGWDLYGWIDSNQCMINLADYLGDMCAYDITNSYSSIYRVHGVDIPLVTGTVVEGYSQVRTGRSEYLVPLLWPAAQKLAAAAEAVLADGYRLKIYDSFRPNAATRIIYDRTNAILDQALPQTAEDGSATYRQLMTGGGWGLGSFLAYGSSMHNFGVAVDLTLERLSDGGELVMQTVMHDLSWYSVISRNNDNANLLDGYMKSAGFGGLVSEWWHFQDNDSYASLPMTNRLEGVTAEGWLADGLGWRYRLPDGSCCAGVETELEGRRCTFDAAGYLVE